jgi:hypothetical protein
MGMNRTSSRRDVMAPKQPPAIWRGIGCLLIIIVPVLSYAAAELSIDYFIAQRLVPRELLITPQVPDWLWLAPVLARIVQAVIGRRAFLAILVLTFVYILFLSGIFSVLYAYMYRLAAPKKYGPLDAPPPRVKIKKYKR